MMSHHKAFNSKLSVSALQMIQWGIRWKNLHHFKNPPLSFKGLFQMPEMVHSLSIVCLSCIIDMIIIAHGMKLLIIF